MRSITDGLNTSATIAETNSCVERGWPVLLNSIPSQNRPPHLTYYQNGELTQVKAGGIRPTYLQSRPQRRGGGIRKPCSGRYTASQRRGLMRTLARLNQRKAGQGWHVTLTYGNSFPTSAKEAKHDLSKLLKRLQRKYGQVFGVHALEVQQRGAPHFEIGLARLPYVKHAGGEDCICPMCWLSASWKVITDGGGVNVQRKPWGFLRRYLSKKAQKPFGVLTDVTRWWGYINKPAYDQCVEPVEVELTEHEFSALRGFMAMKLRHAMGDRLQLWGRATGLSVLGKPESLLNLLGSLRL